MSSDSGHSTVTPTSHQEDSEQTCVFFELPPELRNQVYNEALIHNATLEIAPTGDPVTNMDEWELTDRAWAPFRPAEPALLLTCKQIREEALPIFYGGNVFKETHYDYRLQRFIQWLTPEKRLMVKNLHLSSVSLIGINAFGEIVHETDGCVVLARTRLRRMNKWLEKNGIVLNEGAVKVCVRLRNDSPGEWVASPEGKCQQSACCGNGKTPLQLAC